MTLALIAVPSDDRVIVVAMTESSLRMVTTRARRRRSRLLEAPATS